MLTDEIIAEYEKVSGEYLQKINQMWLDMKYDFQQKHGLSNEQIRQLEAKY